MIRKLLAVAVIALALPAEAGTCVQCVRKTYVAPVVQNVQQAYNAVPYVASTYNFVGAPVRLQAQQAYTMENDPDWQQYLAFKAGLAQQRAAAEQQAPAPPPPQDWQPPAPQSRPSAVAPLHPEPQPPAEAIPPGPAAPQVPLENDARYPYRAQIPTIVAMCSECHSGATPEGDIWLDGSTDLRGVEARDRKIAIMEQIVNGHMPKNREPLTPEQHGQIEWELFGQDEPPAEAPAPAPPQQQPAPLSTSVRTNKF